MGLGEPDASGRRSPMPVKGPEYRRQMDGVVCTIGRNPNPLIPNSIPALQIGKKGKVVADDATVIPTMGAGRKAAQSIHGLLKA